VHRSRGKLDQNAISSTQSFLAVLNGTETAVGPVSRARHGRIKLKPEECGDPPHGPFRIVRQILVPDQ
jgi:hypothetical protein